MAFVQELCQTQREIKQPQRCPLMLGRSRGWWLDHAVRALGGCGPAAGSSPGTAGVQDQSGACSNPLCVITAVVFTACAGVWV